MSGEASAIPIDATTSIDGSGTLQTGPRGKVKKKFPEIEGYKILSVLGQGGMGTVYRAVQAKLSRTVALKVLHAVAATINPDTVTRFRREANAAGRLHHTNIIPVYDFGESPDGYFYAMELIAGHPLNSLVRTFAEQNAVSASPARLAEMLHNTTVVGTADVSAAPTEHQVDASTFSGIASHGPSRPYFREVARWFSDAADALHYAHEQDIIHRDIKPANLILSVDGRVMIADFGLAKTSGDESMTATGTLVGTIRYMSPEQAMAKRVALDHRTDIYSLGATLYELLCFQPAFPGDDHNTILSAVISRDPPPPHKINHRVPVELGTICLKCLEKSPDARYADAKGMADDLRRYLSDLPIAAKRPGPIRRVAKFVRRHKAPVVAVTAVVLLLAGIPFFLKERENRRVEAELRWKKETEVMYESAMTFALQKDWSESESEFFNALRRDPNYVEAILGLSWMRLEHWKADPIGAGTSALEEADELGRRAGELDPRSVRAWVFCGAARKRLENYPGAIEAFNNALDRLEGSNESVGSFEFAALSNLGAVYLTTRELGKAEKCLTKAARKIGETQNDYSAAAWRNLAAFELFQNNPKAYEHILKALDANWNDPLSWVIRARLDLELGGRIDLPKALDHAKHADTSARGRNPRAKRIRALAHLRNDQFRDAIEFSEDAIKLKDLLPINHLIIAIARAKRGDQEAARDSLEAAEKSWLDELREPGAYFATIGSGDLWIDTADELLRLRDEAEMILAAP